MFQGFCYFALLLSWFGQLVGYGVFRLRRFCRSVTVWCLGVLVLVFRTVIVMVWSVIGVTVFSDLGDFADQSFWPNVIFNNRVNNKFRSINPQ